MILVTGDTGNTGNEVIKLLLQKYKKEELVGCSRTVSFKDALIDHEQVDLSDLEQLKKILISRNIKKIIHTVNIRHSLDILKLADELSIEHVVLIHTTGVYSKFRSYSELYEKIEKSIESNTFKNVEYTIVKPTMIYGNHRDHNLHKLIKFLNKSPIFPIFGDGTSLMQPIHVKDLAWACVSCIENKISYSKSYILSGHTVLTYKELLKTVTDNLNRNVLFIHIPIWLSVLLVKIQKVLLLGKTIISEEQVLRLTEDKSYPNDKARNEISFDPRPFSEGINQEINELRSNRIIS